MRRHTFITVAKKILVVMSFWGAFSLNSAIASENAGPPQMPVPESSELLQNLQKALEGLGADYEPRTEHLNSDKQPTYINRLILEKSPYLLQHAHNPVNWFHGGKKRLPAQRKPINQYFYLSATRPVTGAM